MELAQVKIEKSISSCQRALEKLQQSNKRLAIGDLDHAKMSILAAIHLLIAEIEYEEGEF